VEGHNKKFFRRFAIDCQSVTIGVNAAGDTGDMPMSPATFGLPGMQYLWSPADHQHSEHKMTTTFRNAYS